MEPIVTIDDYERTARGTDQNPQQGLEGVNFTFLGLFGEVGTLLSALKKKKRDREAYIGYEETVLEDFGDVLWYFSNIATRAGLKLSSIATRANRKVTNWDSGDDGSGVTFAHIQNRKTTGEELTSTDFEEALLNMAGKVGLLLEDCHGQKIFGNRDALSGHLVEIFRALVDAANMADIDLHKAAQHNITKIHNRWPEVKKYPPLFDEDFGPLEQFPRTFEMHLVEHNHNNKSQVIQSRNGVIIGNPVTDNRRDQDDYRFHDAFHIAYAAILGWSPTLRGLFKLKRKSKPSIDETEDGARAVLIDEGISNLIFQHAVRLNYFERIDRLDYPLLKFIQEFVKGYEVENCPLWLWEKAILDGYSVFRRLRKSRKGIIKADLMARSVTFEELSS
jgi:NTP pyrophosphatase (non-canonical NTP hydrolase)